MNALLNSVFVLFVVHVNVVYYALKFKLIHGFNRQLSSIDCESAMISPNPDASLAFDATVIPRM